jgi:hypothetical protein
MQKSRLIEILRTCSKKELRDLKKWVQSPAHNLREDVILLYDYLLEDDHLWKDEFVAKAIAYARLYPNEAYDDAKMRQVMHFLIKTMEDFLIYQEVSQDEVESRMVLSKVLRKKRIDKLFEKNLRDIRELQERQPYRNDQFFRNQYLLLQEEYVFRSSQTRTEPMNLQQVSKAHDVNYIIDKLRHSCYMLSHQKVYKADYDYGLIQQVIDYVDNNIHLLDTPAIAVYYYGYKATSAKENESNFHALKNEIFNSGHLFPHKELLPLYLMAINYCIDRTNAGHIHYRRESFELYRQGIEKGILIDNGQISRFTFPNVVTLGLYVKEFDWVENFIHNYQHYLEDKHRQDIVRFCLARLHFEKKEFDAAMRICSQADYDDILMNLYSRAMVMKIYYLQNETDALDSYLESFRNYVVRKKVLGYHKSNYKNIISLTKKLFKVNPYSQKDKDKLKKEIEEVNPLTEREWLLEQLKRLG